MLDKTVTERTLGYREVLRVLTEAFGADDDTKAGSLKGRLKHFQGHGLAPPAMGKGRDIRYTVSDVYDWGFALALANLGLPPRFIIKNVRRGKFAGETAPQIERAGRTLQRIYLVYFPSLFLEGLPADADPMTWLIVDSHNLRGLMDQVLADRMPFGMADLTEVKDKIDAALVAST